MVSMSCVMGAVAVIAILQDHASYKQQAPVSNESRRFISFGRKYLGGMGAGPQVIFREKSSTRRSDVLLLRRRQ
jgi:hypothetical protein